jgi:hypothetical protein
MREDLMCFTRLYVLLHIMNYYLENQLKTTYKFFIKMNDLHEVQKKSLNS